MTTKQQSSKQEVEARISYTLELLLCFTPTYKIHAILAEKYPDVKKSARERYIRSARQRMIEREEKNLDQKRNAMINSLEQLYNKAFLAQQYAVAQKILQEKAVLQGLHTTKENNWRDPMVINFSQIQDKEKPSKKNSKE